MRQTFAIVKIMLFAAVMSVLATGQGAAADKFKLGVVAPLTGPSARAGQEHKGAVEMAFEEAGYKIGDYKVELVWIDSEGNPEKATRSYSEAILRQGIQAGLLNWHSSVAVALMEVAARKWKTSENTAWDIIAITVLLDKAHGHGKSCAQMVR